MVSLLLEACSQRLNLRFLQGNRCRLSFGGGLQLLHDLTLFERLFHRERRTSGCGAEFAVRAAQNRVPGTRTLAKDAAYKAACVKRIANANCVVLVSGPGNSETDINVETSLNASAC